MYKYFLSNTCQIPQLPKILYEYIGYTDRGVFIDVGAFDGDKWSNTFGLAHMGWKGLLFEPQPDMAAAAVVNLTTCDVEIVNKAVSNFNGSVDLYLGGSLSTIVNEQKENYLSMDWSKSTGLANDFVTRVPVTTLNAALATRSWPASYEFLSLDVEGSENDVLEEYDIERWRPKIAVVETHAEHENTDLSAKSEAIDAFFSLHDFRKVMSDHINTVYVCNQVYLSKR